MTPSPNALRSAVMWTCSVLSPTAALPQTRDISSSLVTSDPARSIRVSRSRKSVAPSGIAVPSALSALLAGSKVNRPKRYGSLPIPALGDFQKFQNLNQDMVVRLRQDNDGMHAD